MAARLNMAAGRLNKELKDLECKPPEGVICYPVNDSMVQLHAELKGPEDTPYFGGVFQIEINIPERYPMEPPRCQFITKVYHPNIDDQGRICLDILKTGSKGTWRPSLNIQTVLTSLRVLLAYPNPDDPLIVDIANEFKENQEGFTAKAKDYTKRYAVRRIENNNSAYEMKGGASSTEKESDRTKLLTEPQSYSSSSVSSSSTSARATLSSTSSLISHTQPMSTSMLEPPPSLFGLGLGSSISGPGRPPLAKRPTLKKPSLSMRKPTAPSPTTSQLEPVTAAEVDADGCTTLIPDTSSQIDRHPESPQLLTRLSQMTKEAKIPAKAVEDIAEQVDSPPIIPQAQKLSKKRHSGITASSQSLKKSSNKKAKTTPEIPKVHEKAEDAPIMKAKNGISQSKEAMDPAINLPCSDMGPKGPENHAAFSQDLIPSTSALPVEPQIEIQSRFFFNVSETIVETAVVSESEPAPAPAQSPSAAPEHARDIVSDPTSHLPSDLEVNPVLEPGYHSEHASGSKSEAFHEPILEQDPALESELELESVQDDTQCSSEAPELAMEVRPRLDKGKGRAIEPQEVVQKDFTRVPMVDAGMVRKTYVVPLSERQINVPTSSIVPSAPLTVARKRDLLKKRKVE